MAGRGDRDHAERFVSEHDLDGFQHTFDASADTWSAFDQFLVPAYVFIDDDGTVVSYLGAQGSEKMTRRLTELIEN